MTACFGTQRAEALTLVDKGQTNAVIVLSAAPSKAARFGAAELQWHVRQITGVELRVVREGAALPAVPVKIYIGDTQRAQAAGLTQAGFRKQEYTVKSVGDDIFLVGKDRADTNAMSVVHDPDQLTRNTGWPLIFDDQGSLYAVYQFLEEACGVRWLNPYPTGTVLPQTDTLAVKPANARRVPDFIWRDSSMFNDQGIRSETFNYYAGLVKPGTDAYRLYDRLAFKELSERYFRTEPADSKRDDDELNEPPPPADPNQAKNDERAYNQSKVVLFNFFAKRLRVGGERLTCNHSLYCYYLRFREAAWQDEMATYGTTPERKEGVLKRKERTFEGDQPLWFAQGQSQGKHPQLCYSNPEVIRQVVQDARDYYDGKKTGTELGFSFAEPPGAFPLEGMDNRAYCQCDACKAWYKIPHEYYSSRAHSDYWFTFVNAVARELKKTHPDAKVRTLAYMSHAGRPSFPLEPNVEIQFCAACIDSVPWDPWHASEYALFLEWGEYVKKTGRALSLWTYTGAGKGTHERAPGKYQYPDFMAHNLARLLGLYTDFNVQGLFLCGSYAEPDQYVMWNLYFDCARTADKLLNEYFTGLYGPAGAPLKAMYDDIERRRYDQSIYPAGKLFVDCWWTIWASDERMEAWGKLMDQARGLAKTDREKHNVAIFEAGPWTFLKEAKLAVKP